MKVSATFTMQLMSNQTPKMTQVPIEINSNHQFTQIWHGEIFFTNLHNVIDVKHLLPHIKILE